MFTWNYTANTTFTSQWTANTYTVSYNTNGGTISGSPATTVTYNTSYILPSVTKSNNIFNGWFTDVALTTGVNTGPFTGTITNWTFAANTTFYAKWTLNTVTLTWNVNGYGTNRTDNNITINSIVIAPTPKIIGYTFNGWFAATSGGSVIVTGGGNYTVTSAITLYAQFTPNSVVKFSDFKSTYSLTNPVRISDYYSLLGYSTTQAKKISIDFKGKGPNI